MSWPPKAGAAWERAEAERRRTGPPVAATLTIDLKLSPSERMTLAGHLADSASMARSAYLAGNVHDRTAEVVAMVEAIAEAAGKPGATQIPVRLDAEQCRRVRSWLCSSKERAGDLRGVGESIAGIIGDWERITKYSPAAEAAEEARPPRVAAEGGGWTAA